MNRTVKHKVTGEQITFLETADETQGKYLYIEVALPPQGDGPPLHSHDEFEEECCPCLTVVPVLSLRVSSCV